MGGAQGQSIVVTERGTGTKVRITIRSDMTPDEVAEQIRKTLNINEPVVFWLKRHDGVERPIPAPDPHYILEAHKSGAEILFERRRIYGSLFLEHVNELLEKYRFTFNQLLDAYELQMYSPVDNREYKLIIYKPHPESFYPQEPPHVYISPYPNYIAKKQKYNDNHVSSCCMKRQSNSGAYCFFHIDPEEWGKVVNSGNPLLWIVENVVQGLDLLPLSHY